MRKIVCDRCKRAFAEPDAFAVSASWPGEDDYALCPECHGRAEENGELFKCEECGMEAFEADMEIGSDFRRVCAKCRKEVW